MSMAPPSDYSDDAARIDREYVPDSATTEAEVRRALQEAGFPNAAQSHIEGWLVSEGDVWSEVGADTQSADQIQRTIEQQSNGTVSDARARSMADSINSEITSARARAAARVDDNGQTRGENGAFGPKIQNAEEVVKEDGIYFRSSDSGSEVRAARFNR